MSQSSLTAQSSETSDTPEEKLPKKPTNNINGVHLNIPEGAVVVDGSEGYLLEIDGEIVPNYDATIKGIKEGDLVSGPVVSIDREGILIDIGYKSEGLIPLEELSVKRGTDPYSEVKIGEEVDAVVVTKEDENGQLLLSRRKARAELAWKRIEDSVEAGTPLDGLVIEAVKGGLIVDVGIRAFLPASLVDIRRVPDLSVYIGQTLQCKVMEINRTRNNAVLSRRGVLEEEQQEAREKALAHLEVDKIVEGKVSNVVDFGVFVDLGGIDGLIHISELSYDDELHPSEILASGQKVQVKVLDIEEERKRISLSYRQVQPDPWENFLKKYKNGDQLEAKLSRITYFGYFAKIGGVEGLILKEDDQEDTSLELGKSLQVIIKEADGAARRLVLEVAK